MTNNNGKLPEGWRMVQFGDVVRDVKESERNPLEAGLERYIGLEHIEPENLHIKEWGDLTQDDVSFTKRFRTGQVLFAKRRAYQRKVALADFDGICSSDILTFEPKDESLIPELLPFIVQSDAFFDHALDTSSGSLSPRTRWSQLKDFSFPLPSEPDQHRIANTLWATEQAVKGYRRSLSDFMSLKSRVLSRLTSIGLDDCEVQKTRLGSIASSWTVESVSEVTDVCQYGLSIPLHEQGQYPILRMMNYEDGEIIANDLKYVDLDDETFQEFRVEQNDILFNRTNSADLVGKVGIFRLAGDFVFASYLVRLRANPSKILPEYLNAYLNSDVGQRRLLAYATPGVSQTNISAGNLKKVLVPVPPLEEQQRIVRVLDGLWQQRREIISHIDRCNDLKKTLLRELLDPRNTDHVQ